MDRVLQFFLRSFIQHGTLRVTSAHGTTWEFGNGSGKPVVVRFTTLAAERKVLLDPELAHRQLIDRAVSIIVELINLRSDRIAPGMSAALCLIYFDEHCVSFV